MIKNLIIEALHKVAQKQGVTVVPQDYSKEFGQTGSGKAIFGFKQELKASETDINRTIARINDSLDVATKYRDAFMNGIPDETGNIPFKVRYEGKLYDAKIPKEFLNNETAKGEKTNYQYYFNVPELGDGAMQVRYNRRGYGEASVIRSKATIPFDPSLGSAADPGYSREFKGGYKYVTVKVGVKGKYQGENKYYSVFPTPVIDAKIKADIGFRGEILDFMKGGGDYTTDEKGQEISNEKMDFEKKIEKIKKDAEQIIGKPIKGNKSWMAFKNSIYKEIDTPEKQSAMDVNSMTKDFIEIYQKENPISQVSKPEVSLDPAELDAAEKQRELIKARIAAARARSNK